MSPIEFLPRVLDLQTRTAGPEPPYLVTPATESTRVKLCSLKTLWAECGCQPRRTDVQPLSRAEA